MTTAAVPLLGTESHRPVAHHRGTQRHLPLDNVRAFRLTTRLGQGDAFGITLEETFTAGDTVLSTPVLEASPAQVARVLDAVIASVRQSGHTPGTLGITRGKPLRIHEPAGVRLTLTLLATAPVTRHDRIRSMVAGINAMSVEETYYWYAKCAGQHAKRARKALRILLADERPTGG